mmetsp:Transcript_19678/g.29200  ORF Transcript_19678/g.29200 Transcript_19678/m.29200 type:complete len:299 (-) Transcript_19678:59-955(-)
MIRINNTSLATEKQFLQRMPSPTKRQPVRPEGPRASPQAASNESQFESRFPRRSRRSTQSLPERNLSDRIKVPERIHKSNIDPNTNEKINDQRGENNHIENERQHYVGKRTLADSISGNSVTVDKYAVTSASVSSTEKREQRIGTKLGKGKFQTPVGAIAGLDMKTPSIKEEELVADTCPEDFFRTICRAPRPTEEQYKPSEKIQVSNASSTKTMKIKNSTEKDAWDREMEARDIVKMKWKPTNSVPSKSKMESTSTPKHEEKNEAAVREKPAIEKMPVSITKDSFVLDLVHSLLRCE